jgi:hypothetical protein
MKFFESNIHIVFKALMILIAVGIWFALTEFIKIKGFQPLKVAGVLFCGYFVFYVAYYEEGFDIVWSITIGVGLAIISAYLKFRKS